MPVARDAHLGEGDQLDAPARGAADEAADLFQIGLLVARRVVELDGGGTVRFTQMVLP